MPCRSLEQRPLPVLLTKLPQLADEWLDTEVSGLCGGPYFRPKELDETQRLAREQFPKAPTMYEAIDTFTHIVCLVVYMNLDSLDIYIYEYIYILTIGQCHTSFSKLPCTPLHFQQHLRTTSNLTHIKVKVLTTDHNKDKAKKQNSKATSNNPNHQPSHTNNKILTTNQHTDNHKISKSKKKRKPKQQILSALR